jgi:hypothetical protein
MILKVYTFFFDIYSMFIYKMNKNSCMFYKSSRHILGYISVNHIDINFND